MSMAESVTTDGLRMIGIRKSFAGVEVLHGVDFEVTKGEVHALVGENGAGKSTLMKILAGDLVADEGNTSLSLVGNQVNFRSPSAARAAGITMIYQELSYIPQLSVAENLFLGRIPRNRWGLVDRRRLVSEARKLLKDAKVSIDPTATISKLSLASRQIVEIVRAISQNARVIIMDEPTSSLTTDEVQNLFRIIQDLKSAGVSVIYISHHLDEVFATADRVTVLRDGNTVSTSMISEVTHERLVLDMVGAQVADRQRRSAKTSTIRPGAARLSVEHLGVEGGFDDVSFEVSSGEIVSLYGLVSSGQERVARTIYGLEKQYTGTLKLDGKVISVHSPGAAIRFGIGFVPADRKVEGIVPLRDVRENITYPSLLSLSHFGVLDLGAEVSLVAKVAENLRIKSAPHQPIGSLSGGNQQKGVVARWFAHDVKVLVLMEPTRGVDVRAKSEIHDLVRDAATSGVAVLVVSSDLAEVVDLSDRVVVLKRGRVIETIDTSSTSESEILMSAASGKRSI
jgi:ribose transport system ATP-binding protein